MIVTPKKVAVRHNGTRHLPGEEFSIDQSGYERIKAHLDVVDEEDEVDEPEIDETDLQALTIQQLRKLAKARKLTLGNGVKREDIIAAIEAAQEV
jgi:hypothetical protein